jgi:hypothetical protein
MGASTWDSKKWDTYSATTSTRTVKDNFKNIALDSSLNPLDVVMRESRDSDVNPNSTPFIIAGDVTGSMGSIADYFVKTGLGILFQEMLTRKPISDPHLAFYAVGDAFYDRSPLQVSQFEADLKIAEWLEKVHVEMGGGGNSTESYELPYYFAAFKTSHDAFEKRGKKGYIFSYGDEGPNEKVLRTQVKKVIGDTMQADMTFAEVLEVAQKYYYCYHILIEEGSHIKHHGLDVVKRQWIPLFGQNVIALSDHKALAETIISIIEINEGVSSVADVVSSWTGDTSLVVSKAVSGLSKSDTGSSAGIARL